MNNKKSIYEYCDICQGTGYANFPIVPQLNAFFIDKIENLNYLDEIKTEKKRCTMCSGSGIFWKRPYKIINNFNYEP